MVSVCPKEGDPTEGVAEFVRNPAVRVLGGMRSMSPMELMGIVRDELSVAEPDSRMVIVDRDVLSDEDITFPKELLSYLESEMDEGVKTNILVMEDIPVIGWQQAVESLRGRNVQAYCASFGCRQTPACVKMF